MGAILLLQPELQVVCHPPKFGQVMGSGPGCRLLGVGPPMSKGPLGPRSAVVKFGGMPLSWCMPALGAVHQAPWAKCQEVGMGVGICLCTPQAILTLGPWGSHGSSLVAWVCQGVALPYPPWCPRSGTQGGLWAKGQELAHAPPYQKCPLWAHKAMGGVWEHASPYQGDQSCQKLPFQTDAVNAP